MNNNQNEVDRKKGHKKTHNKRMQGRAESKHMPFGVDPE